MKLRFLFAFFILIQCQLFADNNVTISGYVRDIKTGENLPGASINIVSLKRGVTTNGYGFYSISVPVGEYIFKVSYLGFETKYDTLNIKESKKLNIELSPKMKTTKEVIIKTKRKDENVKSTEMGMHKLSIEGLKKLPVILGEVDILKALQLLPGVNSAGEGQSGFYVRGGGPDQNLILLDDATVYNTGHLFGFFSVFNSDAIKNVTLIKGGMPANYGGRLSSVVDITMKDGNNKAYQVDGGIGLIASRVAIQGPIQKNKSSFMVSGRRTYVDAFKGLAPKDNAIRSSGYYFYDLNAKANYKFSDKDRLFLSGYFGKDVFKFTNKERTFNVEVPWGNKTATLRWNHVFTNKLFMNTMLLYNDYNFKFTGKQQDFKITLYSGIKDWNLKTDVDYFSKFGHNFKGGISYTYHTFIPSTISGTTGTTEINPDNVARKHAHETAAYVQDEFDLGKHIKVNAGLRASSFIQLGEYKQFTFNSLGQKADSIVYKKGEIVKSYGGLEPRLNVRYELPDASSIKASVSKTYQYLHLVSNNGSTLPTDIWSPSSALVRPQEAWQYSAGYFKNIQDNTFETSVEVYYKKMKNLVEYREGYTPNNIRDVDYDFVFGTGQSYGAEFFVNKIKGKWTGWIGYTLSWTKRHFDDLNEGEEYWAKYDQRHNLSLVNSYELNKKWSFSSVFVFGSGSRITLPTNLYFQDQSIIQNYGKLNNYSIPPYHRLDLSAVYTPQPKKARAWKGTWVFSIYNIYSRQNPYFLYLDTDGKLSGNGVQLKVKQVSIFPIIPSVTYNFKILN
jgi:hypothetical protein